MERLEESENKEGTWMKKKKKTRRKRELSRKLIMVVDRGRRVALRLDTLHTLVSRCAA